MTGELFAVDDKMLAQLDWLETHPKLYVRSPCKCHLLNDIDTAVDCEVYLLKGFKPELLALPFFRSYSSFLDQSQSYRNRDSRDKDYSIIDAVKS